MKTELLGMGAKAIRGNIQVSFLFSEQQASGVWHSVEVKVFVPASDSRAEITKEGYAAAKKFLGAAAQYEGALVSEVE